MKRIKFYAALASLVAAPVAAQDFQGDPAAGESVFNQCQACHVVESPDGEVLAGRNGKIGPNLYGVFGRQAGSVEGFNYSDAMVEAGEMGLEWNEADFVPYVQDPTGFLREYTDNNRARGKMAFQLRSEEDAHNVAAYIHSLAPEGDSGS